MFARINVVDLCEVDAFSFYLQLGFTPRFLKFDEILRIHCFCLCCYCSVTPLNNSQPGRESIGTLDIHKEVYMYLECKIFSRYRKQRYSNRSSFDNHARTWKSIHETFYLLSRDKRQFCMLRLAFVTCKLTAGWVWNFHPNVTVELGFDIRLPLVSALWLNSLYASCEPQLRSIHRTTIAGTFPSSCWNQN